jgi:hypothetical protein
MGFPYQKHRENLAALRNRFPAQFPEHLAIDWGWPDGWHELVESACTAVDISGLDLHWRQIKEKFGGLRLYWACDSGVPDLLTAYFDDLCQQSERSCAGCGKAGRRINKGGWIMTYCRACEEISRRAGAP